MRKKRARKANRRRTPIPTPAPMPAFAPVERPADGVSVGRDELGDEEEGGGVEVGEVPVERVDAGAAVLDTDVVVLLGAEVMAKSFARQRMLMGMA